MTPKVKALVNVMKECAEKRKRIAGRVGYLVDALEASENGDNTKILCLSHVIRTGRPHDSCPDFKKG